MIITITGEVTSISPKETVTTRSGRTMAKCTLSIMRRADNPAPGYEVETLDVTFWGDRIPTSLRIGQAVDVIADLRQRTYTGRDGVARTSLSLNGVQHSAIAPSEPEPPAPAPAPAYVDMSTTPPTEEPPF